MNYRFTTLLVVGVVYLVGSEVSGGWWSRRRRRRRCDSTPCQWQWGPCSATCGDGERHARITRKEGSCGSCNVPQAVQACNLQCCRVDCKWKEWGNWGTCSGPCGPGTRTRHRTSVGPSCGGSLCNGPNTETGHCENGCCPRNCVWNQWTTDGPCSVACGGGQQIRRRSKAVTEHCGGHCVGEKIESVECATQCCKKDCEWGPWTHWASCDRPCGIGFQTRSREERTQAACGGEPCQGKATEHQRCNEHDCENGDAASKDDNNMLTSLI